MSRLLILQNLVVDQLDILLVTLAALEGKCLLNRSDCSWVQRLLLLLTA